MKKTLRLSTLTLTLALGFCAHSELKSPCDNKEVAAAPGRYVPCDTPQKVNIAYLTKIEASKHSS